MDNPVCHGNICRNVKDGHSGTDHSYCSSVGDDIRGKALNGLDAANPLLGAFLGIRLVKFLPERGFRIFTTVVTIISVLVMLFV